jgi:hypothetical protein
MTRLSAILSMAATLIHLQAYCPYCEEIIAATPILTDPKLWAAMDNHADVEVMHVAPKGDHLWNLNHYKKEHLGRRHAEGLI